VEGVRSGVAPVAVKVVFLVCRARSGEREQLVGDLERDIALDCLNRDSGHFFIKSTVVIGFHPA
jgi:hypothetical protein